MTETVDKTAIDRKVFRDTFLVMKIAGFWAPITLKNCCLLMFYHFYTIFSFIGLLMLIVTILVDQIISADKNFLTMMEYWYMLAIFTNAILKFSNVIMRRDKITNILRVFILDKRWTELWSKEEIAIVTESNKLVRNITRLWLIMLVINGFSSALNPILSNNPNSILMWKCYSPCDRRIPTCFWVCYTYQVFSYTIASMVHLGFDSLILNFIERVCAHVKILQYRLKLLPDLVNANVINSVESEQQYLKERAIDHQNLFNTARALTQTFNEVVFMQFLLSISVLCTNIYFLSKQDLFSADFIAVFVYLCCAMVQNLFYCWYGYKLTQTTAEIPCTIFAMDWTVLDKTSRKVLHIMMLSASKGVSLFNNFIVDLSPEMFLQMLKLSYSAFNLLQARH